MARKIPYLQELNGRFYARVPVPARLRPVVGKRELKEPLGPDRRRAKDVLPAVVAQMKAMLAQAEKVVSGHGPSVDLPPALSAEEIAQLHYRERIEQDAELRDRSYRWASTSINPQYVEQLRQAVAGQLPDIDLLLLLQDPLRDYYARGLAHFDPRSSEGRVFARRIAAAELAALDVVARRDEGDVSFDIDFERKSTPETGPFEPSHQNSPSDAVSLFTLFDDYIDELKRAGRGEATERRWKPVFSHLVDFLRAHRNLTAATRWQAADARALTKRELIAWKDELLKDREPKTVSDVWLAAVRAVLARAVENDLLSENPAVHVRVRVPKKPKLRESGYTDEEATAIIRASVNYMPSVRSNPSNREHVKTTAAKRWAPILCAYSGARVSELTQLRVSDVRSKNGMFYIRITPEAGSVKTGNYRDVPLHQQVIDLGFLDFVKASPDEHLFCSPSEKGNRSTASSVADKIGKWLRKQQLVPAGVRPNHGWRHRFKTKARELGLDPRVTDAIVGHSARTAGEDYGDVTLAAMKKAIDSIPAFDLARPPKA